MSLARQFFREFGPLFRVLEQPLGHPSSVYGPRSLARWDALSEPVRPALDVSDEGDKYVLDAELPGVAKENIEIRVGDSGKSITIEGKSSSISMPEGETKNGEEKGRQISTERQFRDNAVFTRTVWLPRAVDTKNVSAKLENGVLRIEANKAEDAASVNVPVM